MLSEGRAQSSEFWPEPRVPPKSNIAKDSHPTNNPPKWAPKIWRAGISGRNLVFWPGGPTQTPTGAAHGAGWKGPTSRWTRSSVIWGAWSGGLILFLDGSSSRRQVGEPYRSIKGGAACLGCLIGRTHTVSWREQLAASGRWALPTDKRRSSVFGLSDQGPVLPPTGAARSAGKMGPTSRWTRSNVIW